MFKLYLPHQITPYVILFIERDGSTYLTSLLSSHPQIEAIYERFAVLKQKGAGAVEQLEWAKSFFTPRLVNRVKALGFKTKLVDVLDLAGFTRMIQEKGVHVIQMQRRNYVKAVVSRINARRLYEASGNWNLYKENDRMPAFDIDPDLFDQYMQERQAADQELNEYCRDLGLPTLNIVYEELLVDREAVLGRLFEFLQIDPFPLKEKTLKHTSDNLRDVVLNLDDLRTRYAGGPYEMMFDEVVVRQ